MTGAISHYKKYVLRYDLLTFLFNLWGCMCSTDPISMIRFWWSRKYTATTSHHHYRHRYHHQKVSKRLYSHTASIALYLSWKSWGFLSLLPPTLWHMPMIGYIMTLRSCSFAGIILCMHWLAAYNKRSLICGCFDMPSRHLFRYTGLFEIIEQIKCLLGLFCRMCV